MTFKQWFEKIDKKYTIYNDGLVYSLSYQLKMLCIILFAGTSPVWIMLLAYIASNL